MALLPSSLTVMVAVPFFLAVITPLADTLATAELLLLHVGVLPEETVAVSVFFLPFLILNLDALSLIVGDFTVTLQVFDTPSAFTVMVAVPCLTAVTTPLSDTVATLLALELHCGVDLLEMVADSVCF